MAASVATEVRCGVFNLGKVELTRRKRENLSVRHYSVPGANLSWRSAAFSYELFTGAVRVFQIASIWSMESYPAIMFIFPVLNGIMAITMRVLVYGGCFAYAIL
jgi:hypothetical protein